jgi:hypothetical protein
MNKGADFSNCIFLLFIRIKGPRVYQGQFSYVLTVFLPVKNGFFSVFFT